MSNFSIWPIDGTLSGATTPAQSGPGSNGNEGVLCIPQSSCNTGASPSDCFGSYIGHLLGESYPSAQMQSMYSTAPANWATSWMKNSAKIEELSDKIIRNFTTKFTRCWKIWTIKKKQWRCPWCSRYRHRKWTRQHEFKSWTRMIAFHIALIPLGKVWIQLFSLQLWVNSRTD